jgi:hypothetical protein
MTTQNPRTEPEQTDREVRSDQKPLSTETAYQDEVCACCGASPCVTVPMELTYGWRPISEAPRDGTRVLGWEDGEHRITRWNGVTQFGGWLAVPGQWNIWHPTHWMPLPPPGDTDA